MRAKERSENEQEVLRKLYQKVLSLTPKARMQTPYSILGLTDIRSQQYPWQTSTTSLSLLQPPLPPRLVRKRSSFEAGIDADQSTLLQPSDFLRPCLMKRRNTEAGIGIDGETEQPAERLPLHLKHSQENIEVDSQPGSDYNSTMVLQRYKESRKLYEDKAILEGRRIHLEVVKCCDCEVVVPDGKKCYCSHDICDACFRYEGQVREHEEDGGIPLGEIAEGFHDDIWDRVQKVTKSPYDRSGKSSRTG